MRVWIYFWGKNQKRGQTCIWSFSVCWGPWRHRRRAQYECFGGGLRLNENLTFGNTCVQFFKKSSTCYHDVYHHTQQVLKSQGCSPSYHCVAITRPRASTQLESAASLSLTEMLVLSQRNKENILTVREWLSELSWCSPGEKTLPLLFLSVQWKPAEVGVCPWPSIMRFR